MKRFMYFSIGALCLAIAVLIGFHLGARNVEAQAAGATWYPFKFALNENAVHYVMLADGTIYQQNDGRKNPSHMY